MEAATKKTDIGEIMVKAMRERGLRVTPQRLMIAKIIAENVASHPSLKDLHEMVRKVLPGVGVSTVYNTIVMLESMNFIKTFYVEGRLHIDDYRLHVNIYCKDRKEILDLGEEASQKILSVLREEGVKLVNPTILIVGKCGEEED